MQRQTLEMQADRIEMILTQHKAPVRVDGGVVTPRWVRYHLTPAFGTRLKRVQSLAEEIALALGTQQVRVTRSGSTMQIDVPRSDPQAVKLIDLCRRLPSVPLGTAVLGIADDGAPLLLRLPSPDVAHVLVSGTTGSGKTALVQSMILSLALTHRRSQLQLVLIDPKGGRAFDPLEGLPHLLRSVQVDPLDAADTLDEMVDLMEQRDRERTNLPRIVIVIDELADLVATAGKDVLDSLSRLAQRGREAGLHLIACTQKPASSVLGSVMKANFPVRLVGRVTSIEDARVATGVGGSGAEKLGGRGDFIAVSCAGLTRFQSAFIPPHEIDLLVSQLQSGHSGWRTVGKQPVAPQANGEVKNTSLSLIAPINRWLHRAQVNQ